MKQLRRLFLICVFFYLIALAFVYVKQRSFIYFPETSPPPAAFVSTLGLNIADVEVEDVGGIESFFKPSPDDGPTILFFHGNGGSVYHRVALLSKFEQWGAGYLAVEYPGYAGNPGRASERSILSSALAHYDWLIANNVSPENIIIYGHSLGAASAVYVASKREAASLVLTAPFLSATAMGRHRMPYFPTSLLLKDKFRSDLKMARVEEPLIVLHGDLDPVIPHHMGKALSELHMGVTAFITMDGVGHSIQTTEMENYLKDALFRYVTGSDK